MRLICIRRPVGNELGGEQEQSERAIVIVRDLVLNNINCGTAKEGDDIPYRGDPRIVTSIGKLLALNDEPEDNPINYPPKLNHSVPISFGTSWQASDQSASC